MLIKKITYTDYDGFERTETCMFNLTEAELTMMQMEQVGGLEQRLTRMMETHDAPAIMNTFRDLLHRSYGEKSPDGRYFIKVDPETKVCLADKFEQTQAYSEIFMKLCTDSKEAAEFIANVIPKNIADKLKEMQKAEDGDKPNLELIDATHI